MSFILDALKKAEQERGLGRQPGFEADRLERLPARPRVWPWPQLLGGGLVVLLAGAGAITLWRPSSIGVESPVQAPPVADGGEVRAATPAPPAVIARSAELSAPQAAAAASPVTRPRAPVTPSGAAVASAPPRQEAPPLPVEARPIPNDAMPGGKAAVKAGPAGPGTNEPNPGMKLEVHVYSESPAARMVFINGRKYVEGEKVLDKYLIESITEDGVTLTHQGRRLRLVP